MMIHGSLCVRPAASEILLEHPVVLFHCRRPRSTASLQAARPEEQGEEEQIKTAIPFKVGERVRIKEGYFQNYEGDISSIDERNGRIEVMIDIFGRPNPVDMDHWHAEKVN